MRERNQRFHRNLWILRMSDFIAEMEIPAKQQQALFGMQDKFIKSMEKEYGVSIYNRDGSVHIKGDMEQVRRVENVMHQLISLSRKGAEIAQQNVDYAMTLEPEAKEGILAEITMMLSVMRSTGNRSGQRPSVRKSMWMPSGII